MSNKRGNSTNDQLANRKAGNWLVLAQRIRNGLHEEAWKRDGSFRSVAAWLAQMAEREGYTPPTLRRMARVYDYLQSRVSASKLKELKASGEAPLAALEILVRLSELPDDPSAKYLEEVLSGRMTYRHLRDIYNQRATKRSYPNARSEGIRKLKHIEELVYRVFEPNIAKLSGRGFRAIPEPHTFFRRKGRFPYSLPDFATYLLAPKGEVYLDGFEIRLLGLDGKMFQMSHVLALSNFQARFFRFYWLILAEHGPSRIPETINEHLENLGLNSVGLIQIRLDSNGRPLGDYNVIRQPREPSTDPLQRFLMSFAPEPIYGARNAGESGEPGGSVTFS